MVSFAEVKEKMKTCKRCGEYHEKPYENIRYVYNSWEDKKIRYCTSCSETLNKELIDKYFIEKYDGIGIFKANNRYYFGLFSGMSVETLEDARLMVKNFINKSR